MVDTATFTYQCRVRLSPEQDAALAAYADPFGRVERTLFADWAAGARINDPKLAPDYDPGSAYLKRFGLTARQFNAIAIGLKGKIAAIGERRTGLIKEAEQRIVRAREAIARLEKRKPHSSELHQKRRRLAKLEAQLERLQNDHASGRVRLCFGSRRLPSGSAGAALAGCSAPSSIWQTMATKAIPIGAAIGKRHGPASSSRSVARTRRQAVKAALPACKTTAL